MSALEMILLGVIAIICVAVFISMSRQKPAGQQDDGLAELRGQLSQLSTQSAELQRVIASQMSETEGRLGTRLEQ